jgi:hypothetical protein
MKELSDDSVVAIGGSFRSGTGGIERAGGSGALHSGSLDALAASHGSLNQNTFLPRTTCRPSWIVFSTLQEAR